MWRGFATPIVRWWFASGTSGEIRGELARTGELSRMLLSADAVVVDPDSVKGLDAVYACVRNAARTIAALPCRAVRTVPDDRGRLFSYPVESDHWLARLIDKPNRWQDWGGMIEDWVWHLDLHGNAWGKVKRDSMLDPVEIIPYHPDRMRVEYDDDAMQVYHDDRRVEWDNLLHVRGDGAGDGPIGLSILQTTPKPFQLALTVQQHLQASLDEPVPRLALTTERSMGKDKAARDRIEESWNRFTGSGGRNGAALLDQGIKPVILQRSNSELELHKVHDACNLILARMFRTPPHKIGVEFQGPLRNLEEQNRSWQMDRIVPLVMGLERAIRFHLFTPAERAEGLGVRWDLDRLVTGDLRTQLEEARVGILSGFQSPDDVRAKRGETPLPDGKGDVYVLPQNQAPIEAVAPADGGEPKTGKDKSPEGEDGNNEDD